ncbi:MAG: 16S rRNA (guanine(966)-N(2))-methyltransferase RsmD [Thermodesulfovibrionia bacterium]|nr:16S rRNA (guanine(966)-N(2))-methyltransferase RsmD [Thermodesulfovibrionia bacterium]
MRVRSKAVKGKKIRFDSTRNKLRPTASKVKEALFNIAVHEINGARFLDLYAGTGAIGLEALRRGASEVFFVEYTKRNIKYIKHALEKSGFREESTIVAKKALSFIEWATVHRLFFDIIFLDPPYHSDEINCALSAIGRSNILSQNGIVIAEHFSKRILPDTVERLQKVKDYTYGDTVLTLYRISSQ